MNEIGFNEKNKVKIFITTIPENFQFFSRFPDEFTFVTFFTKIGFDSPAKLYHTKFLLKSLIK